MSAVAKNISQPIIDTLTDLGVDIDPILKGIQKTFETVWGGVQAAIQAVVDIVGTVTDAISEFKGFLDGLQLRNPFEGIAAAGQAVMDAIGAVGNQVSGGGKDGDPNTPEAGGTSYFRGGMAQINERGYEQVVLPAGSRVYTHGQTNNLPDNAGTNININLGGVTVAGDMDARRLGNVLRDQLIMAGV
jgi:phage-related protein